MSLSNRRLCECILFLSLMVAVTHPFQDPDGWWHLRTGQLIVETGAIPQEDIFSGTKSGADWVAHEWLTQTFMYLVYRIGGLGFLSVVFSLIAVLTFWVAYIRSPARPYVAALATILGTAAAFPVLGARPQVVSFLFVSLTLALLDAHAAHRRAAYLWWLLPLTALWVNMHAGFVVGLGLIGLRIAGLVLDRWFTGVPGREGRQLSQLAKALAGCLLVVPLNPNGIRLYWYPFETIFRQTERLYLDDWSSPDFHLLILQYFAALILLTVGAIALSKERPRPSELMLLTVTLYLALQSGRHIPIFTLAAIPLLARHLASILRPHPWVRGLVEARQAHSGNRRLNAGILVLLIVLAAGAVDNRVGSYPQRETERFPQQAVDYLGDAGIEGTVFNVYEWGGYLIWRLYPAVRPYIDGRPEIYGDGYVEEFIRCYFRGSNWRAVLDRSDIQTVLIRPDVALAVLLSTQPDWSKVYEDDISVVFVRSK